MGDRTEEQEDPWELPKSRKWRGKQQRQPLPTTNSTSTTPNMNTDQQQKARPLQIAADMTVPKLLQEFHSLEKKWRNTECARRMDVMLRRRGGWKVDTAVCIGIGSFSVEWEHRYRSLWQLVLFLEVVRIAAQGAENIKLYAQEPAFNTLDEAFLQALNMKVLTTGVEARISSTSFVFAPFVDWYILLPIFLKNRDPDLYIGNEVLNDYRQYAETGEKQMALAQCNELGRRFAEGRERMRVPEFELHAHALNGLMVYWREEEDV